MTKETTTKPEIITTDQRQFEKGTQKHQNFLQFCFDSIDYIQKETNVSLTNEDLVRDNAFGVFMKYFAELHKDNNKLGLSGVKLFDLMELDLAKVISIFDKAKVMPHQKQPKIEDYQIFAVSDIQKERLKIARQLLELLPKINSGINFTQPINAPIKGCPYTGRYVENNYWILGAR
jgi:hypothetical protein